MSQISATLPTFGLETQNLALPVHEDGVAQQVEVESSSERQVTNSDPLFALGVNVPLLKNYYKKLRRNIAISIFFSQLILLFSIYFTFVACAHTWGLSWTFIEKVSFVKTAFEAVKTAGNWAQIPTSSGFAIFLFGLGKNLLRLLQQRKRIVWECDLCKAGRYPTSFTPALSQKIFSLFGWRINSFWTGFTIAGLAVVAAVYTYLCRGFGASGSSCWEVKWTELHTKLFTWEDKAEDKALRVILGVFVFGLLIILTTNPLSRVAIKNALKVFNSDEMNMSHELKERVFKLNKRDKIISTVILCILGLALFIILKRLIIAVFNRSFNVSRW